MNMVLFYKLGPMNWIEPTWKAKNSSSILAYLSHQIHTSTTSQHQRFHKLVGNVFLPVFALAIILTWENLVFSFSKWSWIWKASREAASSLIISSVSILTSDVAGSYDPCLFQVITPPRNCTVNCECRSNICWFRELHKRQSTLLFGLGCHSLYPSSESPSSA